MKIRKKIGNLGKDKLQQIVEAFINDLEEGAVAVLEYLEDIESNEYLELELDSDQKILSFTRKDGSHYIYNLSSETIDALAIRIKDLEKAPGITVFEDLDDPEERLEIGKDSKGNIYKYRKKDGTLVEEAGVETPILNMGGNVVEKKDDPEERLSIEKEATGKILSYRRKDGTLVENGGFETTNVKSEHYDFSKQNAREIKEALDSIGFTTKTINDYSDHSSIQISEPELAIINITNDDGDAVWPTSKTADLKYWMQFYDGNGTYFKKRIILNAQGNSSMAFPKKNGAIDICNDEWEGDDTCEIRFGDWAICDSFHLKSYYFDFFKGIGIMSYKIFNQIYETRDFLSNRPWKKELLSANDKDASKVGNPNYTTISDVSLQIDNDAKCVSDGFPAIVYLNGDFYGIYVVSYKKHRSNYNMDSSNTKHIHLDGDTNSVYLFGGHIDWTKFEVRNPKYLVYQIPLMDIDPTNKKQVKAAYKYDADISQTEIAGTDSPLTYDSETQFTKGQMVLYKNRMYLAMRDTLGHEPTANKKAKNVYDDAAANGYWIDITYTNQVKQYIVDLSTRMAQITAKSTIDEQRTELEKYFDIDNLVDYELGTAAIHNVDGQGFNWQWITYDGEKWYVTPWDCERVFGQNTYFNFLDDVVPFTLNIQAPGGTPAGWVNTNALSDLKTRYDELVSKNVITADNFVSIIKKWVDRIGQHYFEMEYDKWPESPCQRDSLVDTDNWLFTYRSSRSDNHVWNANTNYAVGNIARERVGGKYYMYQALSANKNKRPSENPDIWENITYDSEKTYNENDICWFGPGDMFEFKAKTTTSLPPLTGSYGTYPQILGYHDNIWRLTDYIRRHLENMSNFFSNI